MRKWVVLLCLLIPSIVFGRMTALQLCGGIVCETPQLPTEDGASAGDYDCAAGTYEFWGSQFSYAGTSGKAICKVTLWMDFTGSSAHSYYVCIYSNDAAPDPDEPDASLGCSDAQDLSGIGTSETPIDFTFSTPTSALANGTLYWVVLRSDTNDASHFAEWHYESDGATELIEKSADGSTWAQQGSGATFKFKLWSQ